MTQEYREDKLRELVLHIAWHSEGDVHFGAVKLNKLLFFADFVAYRKFGLSITGAEYQKLEHGPAPRRIKPLLDEMELDKDMASQIVERWGYQQNRAVPLRPAKLDRFTAEEIALTDAIIMTHRKKSAKSMSDLSHQFRGWRLASLGETIPYGVALIDNRQPTESERAHGFTLEAEAKACLAA